MAYFLLCLVAVILENQTDKVKGIQVDVCDVDDYLSCTGCKTANRTSGFSCFTEPKDGCCRVLLFDLSGNSIAEGEGLIFTLEYDVSEEAPAEECRDINLKNINVNFN